MKAIFLAAVIFMLSSFLLTSAEDHDDDHDDHDDHGHGPSCYCKSLEQGWNINCADATSIVTGAVDFLTDAANG